jgi:hypothetical protein
MAWERPRICPNVLLVEGAEDLKAIPYIMEANGVAWPEKPPKAPVWIEQYEGYSNLLKPEVLATELQTNGLQALGMIIDADENMTDRWQETLTSCRSRITDLPEDLPNDGLIHETEEGVRVGIWMMPDNTSRGMLETFLSLMIPAVSEPIWEYAKTATAAAQKLGAPFSPAHQDKANIYTWLAWQRPPGQPFPYALKDKILEPTHPNAHAFVTWFKRLYNL